MNHQDYVTQRSERDPAFRHEFAIATAELALATAIAERRFALDMTTQELAQSTGISEERIEAIEEGDQILISEVLRLTHFLDIMVAIEPGFRLSASPAARAAAQL